MEIVTDFISLDSKITADSDCSHEIKRNLLLGRKAMTNPDSLLKSKDLTLLTNMDIVKTMVFTVVIYGCESWNIKKAEPQWIDAFKLWCWRRFLRVPWTARSNSQSIKKPTLNIHWKLKLQYFVHLKQRSNSLEVTLILGKIEGRRKRRGWQRMKWLDDITEQWRWVWTNSGR